jgi:hypothetical protein
VLESRLQALLTSEQPYLFISILVLIYLAFEISKNMDQQLQFDHEQAIRLQQQMHDQQQDELEHLYSRCSICFEAKQEYSLIRCRDQVNSSRYNSIVLRSLSRKIHQRSSPILLGSQSTDYYLSCLSRST